MLEFTGDFFGQLLLIGMFPKNSTYRYRRGHCHCRNVVVDGSCNFK